MIRETLLQVADEFDQVECRNDYLCEENIKLKARVQLLAKCIKDILYHDERGQGIGYSEAMERAKNALKEAGLEG